MKLPEVIWLRPERYLPRWFHSFVLQYFLPFFFFIFFFCFCQASRWMWSINSRFFCTEIPKTWFANRGATVPPFGCKWGETWLPCTQDWEVGGTGTSITAWQQMLEWSVNKVALDLVAGSRPVAFQKVKTRSRREASLLLSVANGWLLMCWTYKHLWMNLILWYWLIKNPYIMLRTYMLMHVFSRCHFTYRDQAISSVSDSAYFSASWSIGLRC